MQIQKTIKFKVGKLSNSKQEKLDLVLQKSLSCLKDIIQVSIIENTTSNKKLHHLCYKDMRKKYKLPACVIHQARNQAVEMLKSWERLQRKLNQELVNYRDILNHQISSYVIQRAKELERPVIVLENLKYIRETTKHRKTYKNIFSNWSFRKLQEQILYKANWEGIPILFIEPKYTSQICPKCFSTNKRKKHNYKCSHCGYTANSDFVGALNIRKKFFEDIFFKEQASINYALDITCSEPKALKIRSVQKPIKLGNVSPPMTEVIGIKNIGVL